MTRVYRQRRARIAVLLGIGLIALLSSYDLVAILREPPTGTDDWIFVLVVVTTFVVLGVRFWRAGLFVNERFVRVVNPFKTTSIPWDSVARFERAGNWSIPDSVVVVTKLGKRHVVVMLNQTLFSDPDPTLDDIVSELNQERRSRDHSGAH